MQPRPPFLPGPPTPPPKSRLWVLWTLLGIVVFALIVTLGVLLVRAGSAPNSATTPINTVAGESSQPTTQATASPAARTATVGDTVAFSDYDGAGTVTLGSAQWTTQSLATDDPMPPKSGHYLICTVTIAATKGQVTPDELFFRLSDPAGNTYPLAAFATDGSLDSTPIPAGRQTRGTVSFDVPSGQPMLLDYAPSGIEATFSIPAG